MISLFSSLKTISNLRCTHITSLIAIFSLTLAAQDGLNEANLSLMKGSFEHGTKILEFRPNTLLLKVKMNKTKQFTEQEIPVEAVKEISINYGFSNGRGVLKGLTKGALTGLGIGLLLEFTASGSDFSGVGAAGGLFIGATLGSLFGLAVGGKKIKRFEINGNLENYKKNLGEMQQLLIIK